MYIERLKIDSAKLLRDVEIDFTRGGEIRNWTVIVGQNGLCNTTILKAIALAASGGSLAARLNIAGSLADRRMPEPEAAVGGVFRFSTERHDQRVYPGATAQSWAEPPRLVSELFVRAKRSNFASSSRYRPTTSQQGEPAQLDPLNEARDQKLSDWFVAAYGVHRNLPTPYANTNAPEDMHYSRIEPLFEAVSPRGSGFADIFTEPMTRAFATCLQGVFVSGGLLPQIENIEFRGRNGVTRAEDILLAQRFPFRRYGCRMATKLPFRG